MQIHLVDGTYELFRAYYGAPSKKAPDGREVGATIALGRTLLKLLQAEGGTHVAVAFDHVIESFRNGLFPGYKTSDGVDPELLAQFVPAEDITRAIGLVVWAMVDYEADDAIATAAARFGADPRVERILICSPDKDLAQCVDGDRVVLLDRRRNILANEKAVCEKFGVPPACIPGWLALVGDSADGIPGIPGWGPRSAAAALTAYGELESVPDDPAAWAFQVRGADRLAASLRANRANLALYQDLATLRIDVPLSENVDDVEWRGAREELRPMCEAYGDNLPARVSRWRE
jgi:5'-3' exonuclease